MGDHAPERRRLNAAGNDSRQAVHAVDDLDKVDNEHAEHEYRREHNASDNNAARGNDSHDDRARDDRAATHDRTRNDHHRTAANHHRAAADHDGAPDDNWSPRAKASALSYRWSLSRAQS